MWFEYLLFNLLVISLPFIGRWLMPKFKWQPKLMVKAVLIVAVPFLIWDGLVTGRWWDFNHQFISGIKLGVLPIEEVLFFITVPFATLVLWQLGVNYFYKKDRFEYLNLIILGIIVVGLVWGVNYPYFLTVNLLALLVILIDWLSLKLIFSKAGVAISLTTLLLTAIFNGYLTARPVVTYNSEIILKYRLGTVPIEDFYYGLTLIWLNILVFEGMRRVR